MKVSINGHRHVNKMAAKPKSSSPEPEILDIETLHAASGTQAL